MILDKNTINLLFCILLCIHENLSVFYSNTEQFLSFLTNHSSIDQNSNSIFLRKTTFFCFFCILVVLVCLYVRARWLYAVYVCFTSCYLFFLFFFVQVSTSLFSFNIWQSLIDWNMQHSNICCELFDFLKKKNPQIKTW